MISTTIEAVLSVVRADIEHAINWFIEYFMQVNSSKFQFMFLPKFTSKEFIQVHDTFIPCNNEVKLLGITIDNKLKFDKQVDLLCKNSARQLNVLYRFNVIFDLREKENIYDTFILSYLIYCLIVNTKKVKKIQERALCFMFNDKKDLYISLLENCGYTTLPVRHIQTIETEGSKSLNNLNPTFYEPNVWSKTIPHDLRFSNVLFQHKWQNVTYGKPTLKNYGSHICNLMSNEIRSCTEIDKFKSLLKSWEGPKCQCTMCNALSLILWTVNILYYICI